VELPGVEVHLVPGQIDQLGTTKAMTECRHDHQGISVSVMADPQGGLLQLSDLGFTQVLPTPQPIIGLPVRHDFRSFRDCPIFKARRFRVHQLQCGFFHGKWPLLGLNCPENKMEVRPLRGQSLGDGRQAKRG